MKKQVLLLGFSVLSNHMYRKLSQFEADDLDVDIFGIGGHHYNYLLDYLDLVLNRRDYDHVILDLVSTPCRDWVKQEHFLLNVETILCKLAARGQSVIFLHFLRTDVDPWNDLQFRVCDDIAERTGIPVIDFARRGVPESGMPPAELLNDSVHFSERGAEWAAGWFFSELRAILARGIAVDVTTCSPSAALLRRGALNAVDLRPDLPTHFFKGTGQNLFCVESPENEPVEFVIPDGFTVTGVYLIRGPFSGVVEVSVGNGAVTRFETFDQHCYYERLSHFRLDMGRDRQVMLRQLPGLADVRILKGKPNADPRLLHVAWLSGTAAEQPARFRSGRALPSPAP